MNQRNAKYLYMPDMARLFNGSTRYITGVLPTPLAMPLTMACWFYPTNVTTQGTLMQISDGTSANYWAVQTFGIDTGDPLACRSKGGGFDDSAITSPGFVAAKPQHAFAVFSSATLRTISLNGNPAASNATAITPTGINAAYIGAGDGGASDLFNGRVWWPFVWNVALTAAEGVALAKGLPPWLMRPEHIVMAPLMVELVDPFMGVKWTNVAGSLLVAPHRNKIYMPQMYKPGMAVAAGGDVTGSGSVTGAGATVSGAGGEIIAGTGSTTASGASVTGAGSEIDTGTGAATGAGASISGAGSEIETGTGAVTAAGATVSGVGSEIDTGTGTVTGAGASVTGAGSEIDTGAGNVTAAGANVGGAGDENDAGAGAVTAAGASVSGMGNEIITGTGSVTAAGASVAAAGGEIDTGAGTLTASGASVAGAGTEIITGSGSVTAAGASVSGMAGLAGSVFAGAIFRSRMFGLRRAA